MGPKGIEHAESVKAFPAISAMIVSAPIVKASMNVL